MKKIILLLIAIFSLNVFTHASFPITENGVATELVVDDANLTVTAPASPAFHWGWFFLGFFLGGVGVLIAYASSGWKKSNITRSAWYGCGVYGVLLIILLAQMIAYNNS